VSPNVDHEISCGERGWLKLWFYAFLITATPNTQGELTEQDRIIRDFIRQHHAVADHCEFLTSYAEFEQSYSRKGGSYGLKDVALTMLLDCIQMFCTYRTREIVKTDNPLANKIVSFISSNVQLNVGIDEICNHVNVSQRTLFLLFKKYFKTSPIQYINTEKISTSIGYLKMGFDIKTIAELMGFTELSSFSRLFKKMTGLSPRSYLSKYNANAE
jgi:AraC-like DNA-binding protein